MIPLHISVIFVQEQYDLRINLLLICLHKIFRWKGFVIIITDQSSDVPGKSYCIGTMHKNLQGRILVKVAERFYHKTEVWLGQTPLVLYSAYMVPGNIFRQTHNEVIPRHKQQENIICVYIQVITRNKWSKGISKCYSVVLTQVSTFS